MPRKQTTLGDLFAGTIVEDEEALDPDRQILFNRMERGSAWDFLSAIDPVTQVPLVWTRDENHPDGKQPFPAHLTYIKDFTLEAFDPADVILVEKSRQMIVTTTILCIYLYNLLFRPSRRILLSKVIQLNAEEILENKIRFTYNLLPEWVKKRRTCKPRPKYMVKCIQTASYISAVSMKAAERECVLPSCLVLDDCLRWRRADSFKPGDRILAFTEKVKSVERGKKYPKTELASVVSVRRVLLPSVLVKTDRGEICVSGGHGFVAQRRGQGSSLLPHVQKWSWVNASDVQPGDRIKFFGDPWGENNSKLAGWVAGMFDGEGSIRGKRAGGWDLQCAQTEGPTASKMMGAISDLGFDAHLQIGTLYPGKKGKLWTARMRGGLYGVLKFLGSIRPERLVKLALGHVDGLALDRCGVATVNGVYDLGDKEFIAMETTSGTLFTDGYFSHNCRGGTATDVFVDEGAYQDNLKSIMDASLPMAKRTCSVTTPNIATLGGRAFYEIIKPAHGLYTPINGNIGLGKKEIEAKVENVSVKVTAVRLHYTADESKRGAQWLANARAKMSDRLAFNREYEIDWSSSTGKPFYTEFYDRYMVNPDYFIRPLKMPTKGMISRGFDFGYRKPACVWFSLSPSGRVFVFREFVPKDIDSFSFRDAVKYLSGEIPIDHGDLVRRHRALEWIKIYGGVPFFKGHPLVYQNFAGDEVNKIHSIETDLGPMNDADIFSTGGVPLNILSMRVSAGTYLIRKIMMPHPDGKGPSLVVDPQCQNLIAGMRGGLTFGAGTRADPIDDEIAKSPEYEDSHDAFRYGVCGTIGTWEESGNRKGAENPFDKLSDGGLSKGVFKKEPPRYGPSEAPQYTGSEQWATLFEE